MEGISMKPINILIADDNEDFSILLKEFFSIQDDVNDVYVALDGIEAIEKIEKHLPDVVVLDMVMPRLDGFGVLDRIKYSKKLTKKPKVIILSAVGQDNITQSALNMGAEYYVVKPFDFNIFMDRIRQVVDPITFQNSMNFVSKSEDYEKKISEVLHYVGIPTHVKGYQYLRKAIAMVIDDETLLGAITISLYPNIAEIYKTTSSRVERSIRHAIELAWEKQDENSIKDFFGYAIHNQKGKPSNGEFIAMVADKILSER
jgi:two-component system response regulator (stage 0 sporulation protein A)